MAGSHPIAVPSLYFAPLSEVNTTFLRSLPRQRRSFTGVREYSPLSVGKRIADSG